LCTLRQPIKGLVQGLRWKSAVGPTAFAVMALALLIYDHLNRRVTELVFWLTLALIVAVFVRMIETVRRQSGVLRQHERSALSDPVTGLENRRKLETDVEAVLATPDDRRALVMLELDGLQTYSDRFGYAAGDDLLRRSAYSLVEAIAPLGGIAYRVDTDRLAALVPLAGRQLGEVVLAATASLRDDAADPVISRAYGDVAIGGASGAGLPNRGTATRGTQAAPAPLRPPPGACRSHGRPQRPSSRPARSPSHRHLPGHIACATPRPRRR
jgi:diguanylate cyclase (GGDEF)-like protein